MYFDILEWCGPWSALNTALTKQQGVFFKKNLFCQLIVKAVMSYSETIKCSTTSNEEYKACEALLVAQCLLMASGKLTQQTHWKQWHSALRFHKTKLWCSILYGYFILSWKIPLLNKRKNNKRNSCLAFDPKGIQWMSRSGEWRRPLEAEWLGTVPVKETQSSADPGEGRGGTLGSHTHMETPCTFLPTIVTVCTKCGYRGIIALSTDTTLSDTSEGNR